MLGRIEGPGEHGVLDDGATFDIGKQDPVGVFRGRFQSDVENGGVTAVEGPLVEEAVAPEEVEAGAVGKVVAANAQKHLSQRRGHYHCGAQLRRGWNRRSGAVFTGEGQRQKQTEKAAKAHRDSP